MTLYRALRFGTQMRTILEYMPALRRLCLCSTCDLEGVHAWRILSKTPKIPNPQVLELYWFVMHFRDFEDFISKHIKTLKDLDLDHIELPDGNRRVLGRLFATLAEVHKLERIHLLTCYFGRDSDKEIGIPGHILTPWSREDEDEDGFTWVQTEESTINYEGRDEVKAVLDECAAYMQRR